MASHADAMGAGIGWSHGTDDGAITSRRPEPGSRECEWPPANVIRRTGLTHRLMSGS